MDEDALPTVAVIVAAHNEEPVIERRVANLRELDYPSDRLEIVVTSDASTDRTEELAEAPGARVIRNPRGGKVAAQDSAVRETQSDVVAFSDANCTWAPDALRKLVRSFADPEVAYVCGRLNLEAGDGGNKEGLYWRFELALRADESRIDSVTGGNGSIYAVRREDYLEVDPRFGHDLSFPYLMVQRGKRAVYEPEAQRLREGDADERGRVPPQGADVRALLGDRGRGEDAARGCARCTSSRSCRTGTSATPAACCTSCCSGRRSRSLGEPRVPGRARAAARAARRRRGRRRRRALLRPRHVGDAGGARSTTSAAECPTTWEAAEGTR